MLSLSCLSLLKADYALERVTRWIMGCIYHSWAFGANSSAILQRLQISLPLITIISECRLSVGKNLELLTNEYDLHWLHFQSPTLIYRKQLNSIAPNVYLRHKSDCTLDIHSMFAYQFHHICTLLVFNRAILFLSPTNTVVSIA